MDDILSQLLSERIADARAEKNPRIKSALIRKIRKLWDNESWVNICKKADTDGSVWAVWWSDGLWALNRELEAKNAD